MLVSALNSHNNICCHGEIFHARKPTQHIREPWHNAHSYEDYVDRPLDLAYSVLGDEYTPHLCLGFKIWHAQSPEVCDHLAQDEALKKIILVRENKLASYSSGLLANKTGIWNTSGKLAPKVSETKVQFNPQAFKKYVKSRQATIDHYLEIVRGEHIHLQYHELGQGTFANALDFLEQKPQDLIVGKKKLHPSNILERFDTESHAAIKDTLSDMGKPDWVAEVVG